MAFLNLRNISNVKYVVFHETEDELRKYIENTAEEDIQKALDEEVYLKLVKESKKVTLISGSKEKNDRKFVTVCFGISWNKWSSNNMYDRNSGHTLIPGGVTKQ